MFRNLKENNIVQNLVTFIIGIPLGIILIYLYFIHCSYSWGWNDVNFLTMSIFTGESIKTINPLLLVYSNAGLMFIIISASCIFVYNIFFSMKNITIIIDVILFIMILYFFPINESTFPYKFFLLFSNIMYIFYFSQKSLEKEIEKEKNLDIDK